MRMMDMWRNTGICNDQRAGPKYIEFGNEVCSATVL